MPCPFKHHLNEKCSDKKPDIFKAMVAGSSPSTGSNMMHTVADAVEKSDFYRHHGVKSGLQGTYKEATPRTKQKPGNAEFEIRQNRRNEGLSKSDVDIYGHKLPRPGNDVLKTVKKDEGDGTGIQRIPAPPAKVPNSQPVGVNAATAGPGYNSGIRQAGPGDKKSHVWKSHMVSRDEELNEIHKSMIPIMKGLSRLAKSLDESIQKGEI